MSSVEKCGYDFETEGSWKRERKYFSYRLCKCSNRRKEECTYLCPPHQMSPWRSTSQSLRALNVSETSSLRWIWLLTPLYSSCTLNKLLAENPEHPTASTDSQRLSAPLTVGSLRTWSYGPPQIWHSAWYGQWWNRGSNLAALGNLDKRSGEVGLLETQFLFVFYVYLDWLRETNRN